MNQINSASPKVQIILASGSPRRKMLLESAGIMLKIEVSEADESHFPREDPRQYLRRTARAKADAIIKRHSGEHVIIISADTIVVKDNNILGKPVNDDDARNMLKSLSGRAHHVMTGVCVADVFHQRTDVFISETVVHFTKLTDEDIEWYIQTGEPRDKAGSYGIQGQAARFVESIEGSYTNVVGLPLCETIRALQKLLSKTASSQKD